MSDPYLGEIRGFCGNFAPLGWALCDGSLLPISENEALFNLLGTTFGGNGSDTFALPDLRGRVPIHRSDRYPLGERKGAESVILTTDTLPRHDHVFNATVRLADQPTPGGNTPAQSGTMQWFTEDTPAVPFSLQALSPFGGGGPHENMHPFVAVSFIISLDGIYPPQS